MLAHSGTTLDRPSRAKARTSSNASQGFFACFRRSARCALVSFGGTAASVIGPLRGEISGRNRKPAAVEAASRALRKPWFYKWTTLIGPKVTCAREAAYSDDNRSERPYRDIRRIAPKKQISSQIRDFDAVASTKDCSFCRGERWYGRPRHPAFCASNYLV